MAGTGWIMEGGGEARTSFAQRIANWFKLVDLNFHGLYPWVLLAPYTIWLGSRFRLERPHWRLSLLIHLAGCILFALASNALVANAGWQARQVAIAYGESATIISDGTTNRTNGVMIAVSISSNGALPLSPALAPGLTNHSGKAPQNVGGGFGGGFEGRSGGGFASSARSGPWLTNRFQVRTHVGPGLARAERLLFWTKQASESFMNFLNVLAYSSLVGIAHGASFYRRLREREQRTALLEAQLTKARLNALQAQLHPHFLFNALNAISTLLRRDARAAQEALASFSELLRLALNQSAQPEVLLRDDLEFVRRYVEVQRIRLGDRLHFEELIAPEALDAVVPALLLQPLVENAIRHGIEPSPNPGRVRVLAQVHQQRLLLTVEDNGTGVSQPAAGQSGVGIGLENLRARLKSLYGNQQHIEFDSSPDGGVRVGVEIPFRHFAQADTPPLPAPERSGAPTATT